MLPQGNLHFPAKKNNSCQLAYFGNTPVFLCPMFCSRPSTIPEEGTVNVRDAAFSQTDFFLEFTSLFTKRFSSRPQKPARDLGKVHACNHDFSGLQISRTKSNLEHKSGKI